MRVPIVRVVSKLVVLLAPTALVGCFGYRLNSLTSTAPLPQPTPISVEGDFFHKASHFLFPVAVDDFKRVMVVQYDTAGLDVSSGYNGGSPQCPVALTIFVSPTPRMSFIGADPTLVRSIEEQWLTAKYSRWKAEITHAHPDAVLTGEDKKIQNGIPGMKAEYSISSDRSRLYVFVVEQTWFLSYRITYPSACSEQANGIVNSFFDRWPGRVN